MRVENKTYSNTIHDAGFKVGKSTIIIQTEEETIRIPLPDGLPEYLCLPKGKQLTGATVRTNGSGDMLYSIYPTSKTHVVRFKKFTAKPGELPMPRMVDGRDIKMPDGRKFFKPEHLEFTVIFEILSGDWAGAEVPYFLEYIFGKDRDGSVYLNGSKKVNEKVYTFLEMCGFDPAQESLKYSENILPDLDQILSERADDNIFQITMEKGYIKTLSEIPAGMDAAFKKGAAAEEEDEDDSPFAEPVRKKTAQVTDEAVSPARKRKPAPEPEPDEDEDEEEEVVVEVKPAKRKVWRED